MSLVRSISGIRGIVGESLFPETITKYVAAFSDLLPEGEIVVGIDGRQSGTWIQQIVVGTLLAMNRKVLVSGITPTPTLQVLVENLKLAGGIAITASHNPANWNGMKFIRSDGTFLSKYENQKLFQIVDSSAFKYPRNFATEIKYENNLANIHIKKIFDLPLFKETRIIEKIKERKFKVVFDANNCSGSVIIPELLNSFGCEVIQINCELNGKFAHPAEPTPENIETIANVVVEKNADIGFVVDPDADRLVVIDENGKPIWEELTIVLAINSIGEFLEYFNPKSNKIVVNYSTTQLSEFIAKKYGLEVVRAPVGEINVVEKMKEVNAVIGGEGSGGVILPLCHYGRDSLVGIALILSLLAKLRKLVSEITSEYPNVYMKKSKINLDENFETKVEELLESLGLSLLDVNLEDGYRFETDFGWVHIRKSNTEPIARIIYETKTLEDSQKISKLISILFER